MDDLPDRLRAACAEVAGRARAVRIETEAIPPYAEELSRALAPGAGAGPPLAGQAREAAAALWLTLDAINFGSGWFPTLRKRAGRSGYHTIATALQAHGPWDAEALRALGHEELGAALGQDPAHELIGLFGASLRDLGEHLCAEFGGSFSAVLDDAEGSALRLVARLGGWRCFADAARYDELELPFLKRAQIAASDLHHARVAHFADLGRLTMFADNLVPHVLRLDGVLHFAPGLVARIEREELIEHGSPEEVEIRACAVHAVELLCAELPQATPAELDGILWRRGGTPAYKARPRHRSRTTAY